MQGLFFFHPIFFWPLINREKIVDKDEHAVWNRASVNVSCVTWIVINCEINVSFIKHTHTQHTTHARMPKKKTVRRKFNKSIFSLVSHLLATLAHIHLPSHVTGTMFS